MIILFNLEDKSMIDMKYVQMKANTYEQMPQTCIKWLHTFISESITSHFNQPGTEIVRQQAKQESVESIEWSFPNN